MDKYRRDIKYRMAMWICWWSVCALVFAMCFLIFCGNVIVSFTHLEYLGFHFLVNFAWSVILGCITFQKVPKIDKLLQIDIKRNPDNIYAKAMILERKLKKQREQSKSSKEREDLEAHVREMEAQVGKHEHSEEMEK